MPIDTRTFPGRLETPNRINKKCPRRNARSSSDSANYAAAHDQRKKSISRHPRRATYVTRNLFSSLTRDTRQIFTQAKNRACVILTYKFIKCRCRQNFSRNVSPPVYSSLSWLNHGGGMSFSTLIRR